MKKLINAVDSILSESLQGLAAIHGDILVARRRRARSFGARR